ncbi:acyltransferase [Mesorhizobium australicum]|uniref:acyltransferase family protein n=1 Tax=Mesorhizobium australicum TaxID=536018 RepID=UPI0033386262
MFYSIQALRALAALLVVAVHCGYGYEAWVPPGDFMPWYYTHIFGAAGVHLFFVISGFVIASQRIEKSVTGALKFCVNRVSRIVPMYWLCTFAFVAARTFLDPNHASQYSLETIWPDLVKSLLFIPREAPPVLGVGWTLNYEMFFYLVFGTVVVLAGRSVIFAATALACFVAADTLIGERTFGVLAQPIVLEFAIGMLIFKVYRSAVLQRVAPYVFASGLLTLFSTAFWFLPGSASGWSIFFAWGLPSAATMLGAVCWESRRPNLLRWRPLTAVGDASYSLYLIHYIAIFGRSNLAATLFLDTPLIRSSGPQVATFTMVAILTIIAIAVHRWIEMPLTIATKGTLARLIFVPSRPALS